MSTPKQAATKQLGAEPLISRQIRINLAKKDIAKIEVIDTDFVITQANGKKLLVRDGALQSMLYPEFSLQFNDVALPGQQVIQNSGSFNFESVALLTGRDENAVVKDKATDSEPPVDAASVAQPIEKTAPQSTIDAALADGSAKLVTPEGTAVAMAPVAGAGAGAGATAVTTITPVPAAAASSAAGFFSNLNPAWGAVGALGVLGAGKGSDSGSGASTGSSNGNNNDNSNNSVSTDSYSLTLNTTLGKVTGGLIYSIKRADGSAIVENARISSDALGRATIKFTPVDINGNLYTGHLLVEVKDADINDGKGYLDEATGKEVDFSETLRSAVPSTYLSTAFKSGVVINVNPLTDLAYQSIVGGWKNTISASAINTANTTIAGMVGLSSGRELVTLGDLKALNQIGATKDETTAAFKYAAALAALSGYDSTHTDTDAAKRWTDTVSELKATVTDGSVSDPAKVLDVLTKGMQIAMKQLVADEMVDRGDDVAAVTGIYAIHAGSTSKQMVAVLLGSDHITKDDTKAAAQNVIRLVFNQARTSSDRQTIFDSIRVDGLPLSNAKWKTANDALASIENLNRSDDGKVWTLQLNNDYSGLSLANDADLTLSINYAEGSGASAVTSLATLPMIIATVPPIAFEAGLDATSVEGTDQTVTKLKTPTYRVKSLPNLTEVVATLKNTTTVDGNEVVKTEVITMIESAPGIYVTPAWKPGTSLSDGRWDVSVKLTDKYGNTATDDSARVADFTVQSVIADPKYAGTYYNTYYPTAFDANGNPTEFYTPDAAEPKTTRRVYYTLDTVKGARVKMVLADGVELDRTSVSPNGETYYFDYQDLSLNIPGKFLSNIKPTFWVQDLASGSTTWKLAVAKDPTNDLAITVDTRGPAISPAVNWRVLENTVADQQIRMLVLDNPSDNSSTIEKEDIKVWALRGPDAGYFDLVKNAAQNNRYELKLKSTIDFETAAKKQFNLFLDAYDYAGNKTTQTVSVNLVDMIEQEVNEGGAVSSISLVANSVNPQVAVVDMASVEYEVDGLAWDKAVNGIPPGLTWSSNNKTITVDPSDSAYNSLAVGGAKNIVVKYNVTANGLTEAFNFLVTIKGTNDVPTVGARITPATVTEGTNSPDVTFSLITGASDVDEGQTNTLTVARSGGVAQLEYQLSDTGTWKTYTTVTSSPDYVDYLTVNGDFKNLTFKPSSSSLDFLTDGEQLRINLRYKVQDASGGLSTDYMYTTLMITGTNDAPTVSASVASALVEGTNSQTIDLLANASDMDAGETTNLSVSGLRFLLGGNQSDDSAYIAYAATGPNKPSYFTLNDNKTIAFLPNDAVFNTLAKDVEQKVYLKYQVIDGKGGVTNQTATITVKGTNDAPTVSATVAAAVNEDQVNPPAISLIANASDVDNGDILTYTDLKYYVSTSSSAPAADLYSTNKPTYLTLNAGNQSVGVTTTHADLQSLAAGGKQYVHLSYLVSDGKGGSVAQTAVITITGTNDAPTVASALTQSVTEGAAGAAINLLTGASDKDSGETATLSIVANSFKYVVGTDAETSTKPAYLTITGNEISLDAASTAFNDLSPLQTRTVLIKYQIKDAQNAVVDQTATFTVTGTNDAPTCTVTARNPQFSTSSVPLFSNASVKTVDSNQTFTQFVLTVSDLEKTDGTEQIKISLGNTRTDIGLSTTTADQSVTGMGSYAVAISGTTATITFNASSGWTEAELNELINSLSYYTSHSFNGSRTVTLTSVKDSGTDNNTTALTLASTVTDKSAPTGGTGMSFTSVASGGLDNNKTDAITNQASGNVVFTYTGSDLASGEKFQYTTNGTVWNDVSASAVDTTANTVTVNAALSGSPTIRIRAIDGAGNATGNLVAQTITYDGAAPGNVGISIVESAGVTAGDTIKQYTAEITGFDSTNRWQYKIGAGNWQEGTSDKKIPLSAMTYAVGAIEVRQIDAAGNASNIASNPSAFTVTSALDELGSWLGIAQGLATGGVESFVQSVSGSSSGQLMRMHKFDTVNSWTSLSSSFKNETSSALAIDYLLVGGGGSGGNTFWGNSGGGGGGQVMTGTTTVLAGDSSAVTVGRGGARGAGTASTAFGATANGGGAGGSNNNGNSGSSSNALGPTGGASGDNNLVDSLDAPGVSSMGSNGGWGVMGSGGGGGNAVTGSVSNPSGPDATAPALSFISMSADKSKIYMVYNELLDEAAAVPATRFWIGNGGTQLTTVSSVSISRNMVTLNLTTALTSATAVQAAYGDPSASNETTGVLQDAAGNDVASTPSNAMVVLSDTFAPVLLGTAVQTTGGVSKVVLMFNKEMSTTVPDKSAFTVTVGGVSRVVSAVETPVENTGGGTVKPTSTIELTLDGAAVTAGQPVVVGYKDPTTGDDAIAIQDAGGRDWGGFGTGGSGNQTTAGVGGNGLAVDITGTNVVYGGGGGGALYNSGSTNMNNGGQGGGGSGSAAFGIGFKYGANGADDTRVPFSGGIDSSGTPSNWIGETSLTGDKVRFYMSEPLDATNLPAAAAFKLTVNGIALTSDKITGVSIQNLTTVELTLRPGSYVTSGQTVALGYTDPTTNNDVSALQDLVGNDAASFNTAASPTVNIVNRVGAGSETTAPILVGFGVDNTDAQVSKVVMSYNEALASATTGTAMAPLASSFAVQVGNELRTVSSVSIVDSSVVLTLSGSKIGSNTYVAVRYTGASGNNAIQDLAGNDAPATIGQSGNAHNYYQTTFGDGSGLGGNMAFAAANGASGLGGGGGGVFSGSESTNGGAGGSGTVITRYDTGVDEAALFEAIKNIFTGDDNLLQQTKLATYLNAIEPYYNTADWNATFLTGKITAVL